MIIPMLCVTIFVILVVWFLLPRVARLMIHTPTAISIDRKSGSAGMPRPISYAVFCLKKKKTEPARPRTHDVPPDRPGELDPLRLTGPARDRRATQGIMRPPPRSKIL